MHKQFVIDTNGIMKAFNQFANTANWDKFGEQMENFAREVAKDVKADVQEFKPAVDIAESAESYFVHVELPGVAKEDVSLTLSEDNILTVSGNKKVRQGDNITFARTERVGGDFKRTLKFDEIINDTAISAEFRDGVLAIALPKLQPAKPKEIAISIG